MLTVTRNSINITLTTTQQLTRIKMTNLNNMQKANEMFTAFLSDNDIVLDSSQDRAVSFMERYYGAGVGSSVINSTPIDVYVG